MARVGIHGELESTLLGVDGIRTVHGNELTGSLLVVFDRDRSVADIARVIADSLERTIPSVEVSGMPVATPCLPTRFQITTATAFLGSRALDINALPVTILASSPLVLLPITFLRTFLVG